MSCFSSSMCYTFFIFLLNFETFGNTFLLILMIFKMGTVRKRNTNSDNNKKLPNLVGNETKSKKEVQTKLFSIKLEIYQNMKALQDCFNSVTMSDILNLPSQMKKVLLMRERKRKVIEFDESAWFALKVIVLLTIVTRFYQIDKPAHVW